MHIPVLLNEVLEILKPVVSLNHRIIDGTVGDGGHAKALLGINPKVKVLGIDLDQTNLDKLQKEFTQNGLSQRITLICANYAEITRIASEHNFAPVSGIILDLGFSSSQLDRAARGFSFQTSGPLDMRYNLLQKLNAQSVINKYPEEELNKIFKAYGEERYAKSAARRIVEERKKGLIQTTDQLLGVIKSSLPANLRHQAHDTARRIFQAIRIEVNSELENLRMALPQIFDLLLPGGRAIVISFHSLEDRIVKNFFKELARGCVCPEEFPTCVCGKASNLKILTRKPIRATLEESSLNPRSKGAKLRAAEKIAH